MALFVTKQFPAILVWDPRGNSRRHPTRALIPRSFAWLDPSSPCCRLLGRSCHFTALIGHSYARLSGLHLALPPPQSISGNKMVGSRWSFLPELKGNLSKYGSTSKFRHFVHGMAWQMGHNSRHYLFRT